MSRYDQEEGVAYGVCVTCNVELATKEDASRHMEETMTADGDGNRSSHTTRATNPTREQRIRSMVDNAVQDAIQEALENLEEEIDRGRVTREEVAAELIQYPDFSDEWERS